LYGDDVSVVITCWGWLADITSQGDAQFVLLVEKDAVFMRLSEDRFYNDYPWCVDGMAMAGLGRNVAASGIGFSCVFLYLNGAGGGGMIVAWYCFDHISHNDVIYAQCGLPCSVIITARGQPDLATRLFLKRVKTTLNIPILGLFDSDPYGLRCVNPGSKGSHCTPLRHYDIIPRICSPALQSL
jgi:hypothetical protein